MATRQLEVCQELSLVKGQENVNGFDLEDEAPVHEDVDPTPSDELSLVMYFDQHLPCERNVPAGQLDGQCGFVMGFSQSRAQLRMHRETSI